VVETLESRGYNTLRSLQQQVNPVVRHGIFIDLKKLFESGELRPYRITADGEIYRYDFDTCRVHDPFHARPWCRIGNSTGVEIATRDHIDGLEFLSRSTNNYGHYA